MHIYDMPNIFAVTAVALLPLSLAAQDPPQAPDTTRQDTVATPAPVTKLPDLNATAARSGAPLHRLPASIGTVGRTELQRGQPTLGLDETLNNLPGVVVANRYNFSLDQRISIRGFGARANFGVRGLRVLLDGVPQTLPDGQSQLTNLDLANIERVEVLRGSSSSLHGNASGGVISFQSEPAAPVPFAQQLRIEGGNGTAEHDDFYKWQSWTSGRNGPVSGTLSISQFKADGFRSHSAAEVRQLNAGIDYLVSPTTIATLRVSAADNPRAQNPGALTSTEYGLDPHRAAPNNINRGADKDVQQQQLSLSLKHFDTAGNEYAATVYGILRDLTNPIAAPPDGGTPGPNAGTFIVVDRTAAGTRLTGSRGLGSGRLAPRLVAGADVQHLRDDRNERQSLSGAPTSTVLVDQLETITEIGPFAQVQWFPSAPLLVSAGARYDWVRFNVDDRFSGDGEDNSGGRTMQAASGNIGASWTHSDRLIAYTNLSTSFETPTTTELKNQPVGSGGFNDQLDPQRAINYEIGARGQLTPRFGYSVSLFLGRISDAIVQAENIDGRAYFRNAGKVHNEGAEVGVSFSPVPSLTLRGAYTFAHYRFADYKIVNGATTDTLDGNRLPGVPEHFWRVSLRSQLLYGFYADADHTLSSSVTADDANTLYAGSWHAGVTNLRVGWSGGLNQMQLSPFIGINNLWSRDYIASVTLNGVAGRVYEPAPGRVVYVGTEIGYRSPR